MKLASRDPRNKPAEEKIILLAKVKIESSTQGRVRMNPERVQDLSEVLKQGRDFKEPVEVYDDGFVYWVGDGFHRLAAYEQEGRMKIKALVREGTHRDALIHAAGANDTHGMPRTGKDVRHAICLLLDEEDLAKLSDRSLAALAHCSDKTVASVRKEFGKESGKRTYTDKHGNVSEMNVSELQKRRKSVFSTPVNTFHELRPEVRQVNKELLRVISRIDKGQYAFELSWLKGHLPDTPKEAEQLLTQLEMEEGQGQEMETAEKF